MDLFLLCLAAAYMIGGKFDRDKAQAAYKAGKEPPGLVKARMRHQRAGGTTSASGRPKGPGATRMLLSQRWSQACEKSKDRADDKHRRWRQWYAETAPDRDEQWRKKMAAKIEKREARTEKFARARGLIKPVPVATAGGGAAAVADEDMTTQRPAAAGAQDAPTPWVGEPGDQSRRDEGTPAGEQPDGTPTGDQTDQQEPTTAAPVSGAATEPAGGVTVYQQAVAQLHNHADECDGYAAALPHLGDEMAEVGWGTEVSGELTDVRSVLQQVAGRYRDLADQMQQQGDAVNDAYDQAPWAPDKAALVRS